MKHTKDVTILILILFLLTQFIGLTVIYNYIQTEQVEEKVIVIEDGKQIEKTITVEKKIWGTLPYGIERPQFKEKISYIEIAVSLMIATVLALFLIKLQATNLWRIWFFLSIWFTLTIAFGAFLMQELAVIFALILAILKSFRRNILISNFSELFIYGGLAAIFVPILNVLSVFVLLILISIYDGIAVWKTKHMIKLAKFQTRIRLFAGLMIPYGKNKLAILGGGDMGFSLLFAGVAFKMYGWIASIIIITTTIALGILLVKSDKNKYYPAMPFLSAGCFLGYLIVYLIHAGII